MKVYGRPRTLAHDAAAAGAGRIAGRACGAAGDRHMKAPADVMQVAVNDRGPELRERLRSRLEQAAQLRCPEHDQPVIAVTIHARENGWFDSTWITCCPDLERQATGIVKDRY
jgi:hypothetical protein